MAKMRRGGEEKLRVSTRRTLQAAHFTKDCNPLVWRAQGRKQYAPVRMHLYACILLKGAYNDEFLTGELFLPSRTANQYLARYWFAVATVKIVHRSEIHHKSSSPRGWDGCTFVGADLRVCDLWVRSRSLAATRGRSGLHSTPGLASTVRTVPGNTPGSHGPGNSPGFTMIHPFWGSIRGGLDL
jgi:hypothetical protein